MNVLDLLPDPRNPWRSVANEPPPEGLVVQVMNNGGAHLVRDGGLWFFPDRSMYVYYTPKFWRLVHAS